MFEQAGNAILSINFLGLGSSVILIMLTFGISYLVSQGQMSTFLYTMIFLNYSIAALLFIGYKEANFAIVTTIILILILLLPDGTKELIFKEIKE